MMGDDSDDVDRDVAVVDGSVVQAEPGADSVVHPEVVVSGLSESEDTAAEDFAVAFLSKIARLRGVRIDREQFLRSELHKRGVSTTVIDRAVEESPAVAGLGLDLLDQIATAAISFETRKSTALSFASGLPGGFAIVGAVPADITQFYVHAFRVMQKLAYVYGWQSFLTDADDVDDETLGKLAAFLGVMLGVGGASNSLSTFAAQVARPAVQKKVANVALTKTAWYVPMKQTLRIVGVQVTKQSFARTVSKVVPVVGGAFSGGMTFVTLKTQSTRLMKHLREIPPPNVDAEDYLAALRTSPVSPDQLEGQHPGAEKTDSSRSAHLRKSLSGAGSAARTATTQRAGRVSSVLRRPTGRKQSAKDSSGADGVN